MRDVRHMTTMRATTVAVVSLLATFLNAAEQNPPPTAEIPILPYKPAEWPTPPTSAAGVPGSWNFIQVASGTRGKGRGEFGLPHNLVIDSQNRVYVTDRDNQRIEIFDANGKFLSQWTGTGGVSGLAITKDQRIWTGGILRDLEGKVLGSLPGTTGGHGVAVTDSGDVYIAQLSGVVQKFVKQ